MKMKNNKRWGEYVAANENDGYGKACLDYAKQWAELMEERMAAGATVVECAKETSNEVDRRPGFGITGFMYGAVVAMLSECWEHGEELRRWHNLDTQIGNEGERANENGGVLNPAVICFGK